MSVLLGAYLIGTLVLSGVEVFLPYLSGLFVDNLLNQSNTDFILQYVIVFTVLSTLSIILGYFANQLYIKLTLKPPYHIQQDAMIHMQNTSMLNDLQKDPSYLNHRVNNDSNMLMMFSVNFIQLSIVNLIKFVVSVILLAILSPVIAFALVLLNVFYGIAYKAFQKPLYRSSYRLNELKSYFFTKENDQFIKIPFLQAQGLNKCYSKQLEGIFDELEQAALYDEKLGYWFMSIDKILLMLANVFLFVWGGYAVLQKQLTIGEFVVILAYFNLMMEATKYYFTIASDIPEVKAFLKRMEEVMSQPLLPEGITELSKLETISVDSLSFAYPDSEQLYRDWNYAFRKGNLYILKGKNGSGKSTLIKLILGLYEMQSGDIKYNGMSIKELNMTNIRRTKMAYCEQEPELLNQTLRYNLTLGLEYEEDELNHYLNLFHLDHLLSKLEQGLETLIEDDAENLSGGEKQKVAIIRSFLKHPDFIFMDEPTSALDQASKISLITHLSKNKNDKIIILSTHDSDLIDIADEVIQLS